MTTPPQRPLKGNGATPDDLKRALEALSRQDEGSARLARVGMRLGPVLDAGLPIAEGRPLLLRFTAHLPRVLRVVLAGSAVTAAVWFTAQGPRQVPPAEPAVVASAAASVAPTNAVPNVTRDVAAPSSHALEAPRAQAPLPVAAPSAPVDTASVQCETPPSSTPPKSVAPRARQHKAPLRAPSGSDTALVASAPVATPAPAPVAAGTSSATSSSAMSHEPISQLAAEPAQVLTAPRAPSEAALLVEARRKLGASPAEALAVLDQHAQRFATGMLAPEREVMAIEALRALGHATEADKRTQAFRQKYPDSLHLRRLDRQGLTAD